MVDESGNMAITPTYSRQTRLPGPIATRCSYQGRPFPPFHDLSSCVTLSGGQNIACFLAKLRNCLAMIDFHMAVK
jgi:hypothetical protein